MKKEEILAQLRGNRAQILDVLAGVTEAELHHEPAPGRWSAAGLLRHLIDFEEDILNGLDDRDAGRTPFWHSIKDWNARNAERAAQWPSKPMPDVRAAYAAHRVKLEERLMGLTEEQVAQGYGREVGVAAVHDFEHLPSIRERIAVARGNAREATVRFAEIARNELLALLFRIPEAAFEERIGDKWSIKEILLHLAGRDRHWAKLVRAVSAGAQEPAKLTPAEQEEWNQRDVASRAHYQPYRVIYDLGEARGLWVSAMLAAPDAIVQSEAYGRWAKGRLEHDRHHYEQIGQRLRQYRQRTQG